jgi:hypothetical protein
MPTITIRNDSSADHVGIFIDKKEINVANGQQVQEDVSGGVHALLWLAQGKKDQTVKITVRNSTGVAARVNRTLKDDQMVADGTTFTA